MQLTYYEEMHTPEIRQMIVLINQSVTEVNRILDQSRGVMIHSRNPAIKVFKHSDEEYTRVIFPMSVVSATTEFADALYRLMKSEAHGRRE